MPAKSRSVDNGKNRSKRGLQPSMDDGVRTGNAKLAAVRMAMATVWVVGPDTWRSVVPSCCRSGAWKHQAPAAQRLAEHDITTCSISVALPYV